MTAQLNLKKEKLDTLHEFKLIYSGPTFESGIKIKTLIENLKSIQELIYSVADVNSEYKKGYNSSKDIKEIKIIPRMGSLEEEILVLFSNPEVRSVVAGTIISLFFYILGKYDSKKSDEKIKENIERIEDLIVRNQLKNVQKLYEPLEQKRDTLKIVENNIVKLEINFIQKEELDNSIRTIERDITKEVTTENIEGYISAIDIDTDRLKFHPTGEEKAYPLEFNQPLGVIASLIGKEIRAKMAVTKFKDKIRRFKLLEYKIIQRDLNDFTK